MHAMSHMVVVGAGHIIFDNIRIANIYIYILLFFDSKLFLQHVKNDFIPQK